MKIIKKVKVKQIVTEESKSLLRADFNKQKMRLEQEYQQLLFEQRKLQNKRGVSKKEIAERFQQEVKTRKEKVQILEFKLEQLDMLEVGSEIIESEVEALVEVKEGSHWEDIMKDQSIVIKNGVVIRIDK